MSLKKNSRGKRPFIRLKNRFKEKYRWKKAIHYFDVLKENSPRKRSFIYSSLNHFRRVKKKKLVEKAIH